MRDSQYQERNNQGYRPGSFLHLKDQEIKAGSVLIKFKNKTKATQNLSKVNRNPNIAQYTHIQT